MMCDKFECKEDDGWKAKADAAEIEGNTEKVCCDKVKEEDQQVRFGLLIDGTSVNGRSACTFSNTLEYKEHCPIECVYLFHELCNCFVSGCFLLDFLLHAF